MLLSGYGLKAVQLRKLCRKSPRRLDLRFLCRRNIEVVCLPKGDVELVEVVVWLVVKVRGLGLKIHLKCSFLTILRRCLLPTGVLRRAVFFVLLLELVSVLSYRFSTSLRCNILSSTL